MMTSGIKICQRLSLILTARIYSRLGGMGTGSMRPWRIPYFKEKK